MNNCYCVCTMPNTYPSYVRHWDNFEETNFKLEWVSDITQDPDFNVGFTYTEQDVKNNLNFDREVSKSHFYSGGGKRNIIWFYAHFRMMNYYLSNPNYDYYWFFDDDVRADNWVDFFKGFENVNDDFISYFVFKNEMVEDQPHVPKIDSRTHSGGGWFLRFPGDGDLLPDTCTNIFGSFFPIVRYSKRAMEELVKLNEQGYSGYSEGFVPTVLNDLGLKVSTLINSDDTSDFFDVDKVNIKHKNIKVKWEWI